jgi:CHAD domain-containing protein
MLEEERKYEVSPDFELPDLSGCAPSGGRLISKPAVTLRATYYDTPDRRLARAGLSFRYRRGELTGDAWTVKLPTGTTGIRQEVSRPGPAGKLPAQLVDLLTAYHRGAPIEPAMTMRTVRRVHEIRDDSGAVLVEIADDTVSVLSGRRVASTFREIEVERKDGKARLMNRVEAVLREAGAHAGDFIPKHVRAMGPAASEPPDLPPPARLGKGKLRAGEVVTAALRHDIGRIIGHDPWVRLRAPLPDGDTGVHQMRVGCRRLRSDLRSFRPLLEPEWVNGLRDELSWLADALGAVRDAEVLRIRLRRTAGSDPLAGLDEAAIARIDADLAARYEDAVAALDAVLRSGRYLALVESLVDAARAPRLLAEAACQPAAAVLPRLAGRPWRRLAKGKAGVRGAGDLEPQAPDSEWHAVRIAGKKARYATEAVAGALGGPARELASALADVQELLGEHQDAAVAADTWLGIAHSDPDDHTLAVTAGRLYERERATVRTIREKFPDAWRAAARSRLTGWLR